MLNDDSASPEASRELLQEGVVMAAVDHPNVVRLYAVCMGKQMMLVSQFVPLGSLISYLKKNKEILNAHVMLNFATQIAEVCGLLRVTHTHTHTCTHAHMHTHTHTHTCTHAHTHTYTYTHMHTHTHTYTHINFLTSNYKGSNLFIVDTL